MVRTRKGVLVCEADPKVEFRRGKKAAASDTNLNPVNGSNIAASHSKQLQESEIFTTVIKNVDPLQDPIEINSEIANLLCGEEMPPEALVAFNEIHVQTDETLTDYIGINRKRINQTYRLKSMLMRWKREAKKLRLEKKELIKKCHLYNDNSACELPKSKDSHKRLDIAMTTSKAVQTGCQEKNVCGLIEFTMDKLYNLSCFYCSEQFPIWTWTQFIAHIEAKHNKSEQMSISDDELESNRNTRDESFLELEDIYKIEIDDNEEFIKEERQMENIENEICKEKIVVESDNDLSELKMVNEMLHEEFLEESVNIADENVNNGSLHESVTPPNDDETETALEGVYCDSDGLSDLSDLSNNHVTDLSNNDVTDLSNNGVTICNGRKPKFDKMHIAETDPNIMIAFLELLKSYPILWNIRFKSMEPYDSALAEVVEILNSKWDFVITPAALKNSLSLIKLWYRRRAESDRHGKSRTLKNKNKRLYFNKCAEIEVIYNNLTIACDLCDCVFLDEKQFQIHQHFSHNVGELPYKCQPCETHFSYPNQLKLHEERHIENSISCPICDKVFHYKSIYENHLRKHKNEEDLKNEKTLRYKCEICGKAYRSLDVCRSHQVYHKPPKYCCEICPKKYYQLCKLTVHVNAHRNERNFVCDRCGKAFLSNKYLLSHTVTHSNRKKYCCIVCGLRFTQSGNMLRHQRNQHLVLEGKIEDHEMKPYYRRDNNKILRKKKLVFTCKLCKIEFNRLKGLRDHNKMVHKHPAVETFKEDGQQEDVDVGCYSE